MRSGYEQFVAEQAPALLRLAFVLTGDAHRAEDLTQTTLLDAHRRWRRVSGARHPDAYVRRMLVNSHVEWHRRRSSSEVPTDLEPERTAVAGRRPRTPRHPGRPARCSGVAGPAASSSTRRARSWAARSRSTAP